MFSIFPAPLFNGQHTQFRLTLCIYIAAAAATAKIWSALGKWTKLLAAAASSTKLIIALFTYSQVATHRGNGEIKAQQKKKNHTNKKSFFQL